MPEKYLDWGIYLASLTKTSYKRISYKNQTNQQTKQQVDNHSRTATVWQMSPLGHFGLEDNLGLKCAYCSSQGSRRIYPTLKWENRKITPANLHECCQDQIK